MRRGVWPLLAGIALAMGACSGTAPAPDLSAPTGPVSAVINAAKQGDPTHLAGLCDPAGEVDSDARRICRAGPDRPDDWQIVEDWFKGAVIASAPRIEGERAEMDLTFGPGGERRTEVVVVAREGKWYLSAL